MSDGLGNNNTVLLDGKVCDGSKINPEIHRYLGTFRPPFERRNEMSRWYHTSTAKDQRQLWMDGSFDIPQYVTIVHHAS